MGVETSTVCSDCQGQMAPIVIMDKYYVNNRYTQELEYRLPDDKISFWSGKYPTAGKVQAFLCGNCGKIALYGSASEG